MDWIETWFGVSPDGGNGVTEWLIVLAGVSVAIAVVPALRGRALGLLARRTGARPAALPKADR